MPASETETRVEAAREGTWSGYDEITLTLTRASAIRLEQDLTLRFGGGRLVNEIRAQLAARPAPSPSLAEEQSRVAEDVERLWWIIRRSDRFLIRTPTDLVVRVLDALETAQVEAQKKDETIARLRKLVLSIADSHEFGDGFCGEMPDEMRYEIEDEAKRLRALSPEQGDEG